MTVPFGDSYDHVHISEREAAKYWPDGQFDPAGWEDCLWVGATELHRYAGGDVPALLAEAEALRDAAGVAPSGPGSNHDGLRRGMLARYGRTFRRDTGEAALLALGPGYAAVISGSLGNFPLGHALRRWDKNYVDGHAVTVYRIDESPRWWWCDGLAPTDGYSGQWVTDAQAKQFMYDGSTFSYAALGEFKEAPMIEFIDSRAREVDLKAGAVLIDEAGRPVKTLATQATVVAPVISDGTYTVVCASVGGKNVLVRAKRTDIVGDVRFTNEVEKLILEARLAGIASVIAPPDMSPFTDADIQAADLAGRRAEWDRQRAEATITGTPVLAPRP